MKKYVLVALIGLAVACSSSRHGTAGSAGSGVAASGTQDGGSYETAVVIQEKHETAGVSAEYKWCADHYPGYKTQMQALTNNKGKPYDVLTIVTTDGTVKKVYFDISHFFGKF
jgi:hypothetical protein